MAVATEIRSIAGVLPVSMVDWAGKLAALVFLRGCNLRCPYCHIPDLVLGTGMGSVPGSDLGNLLKSKEGWIDGVVITGGEPTISPELNEIIDRVRALGLKVKLDTNGTRPDVIRELLDGGRLSAVSVDVKCSFDRYEQVTKVKGQGELVEESIELVTRHGLEHEFRTTVVPGYVEAADIRDIAQYLGKKGAQRYFLQQFNPENTSLITS